MSFGKRRKFSLALWDEEAIARELDEKPETLARPDLVETLSTAQEAPRRAVCLAK